MCAKGIKKRESITIGMPVAKREELNALAIKTGIPVAGIVRSLIYAKLDESKIEGGQ